MDQRRDMRHRQVKEIPRDAVMVVHGRFVHLTWILEEGVPDARAAAVLERVPLDLVRRRRRPEDEAGREALPGEVAVVAGHGVRAERQGEGEEPMEEQWRKSRHDGAEGSGR